MTANHGVKFEFWGFTTLALREEIGTGKTHQVIKYMMKIMTENKELNLTLEGHYGDTLEHMLRLASVLTVDSGISILFVMHRISLIDSVFNNFLKRLGFKHYDPSVSSSLVVLTHANLLCVSTHYIELAPIGSIWWSVMR